MGTQRLTIHTSTASSVKDKMINLRLTALFAMFCLTAMGAPAGPDFSEAFQDEILQQLEDKQLSIPIHGKWCGPGHGLSTLPATASCIDTLDCACRAHDICYKRYGFGICKCDQDVINAIHGQNGPKAVLVRNYFRYSPCRGPFGWGSSCRMRYVFSNKGRFQRYVC